VPDILFFEVPKHVEILKEMLKDYQLGEHILLIGNQGVGKNVLSDRLLQMLCIEREYIQLHRDTTVQTLTLFPSIHNGVLVWEVHRAHFIYIPLKFRVLTFLFSGFAARSGST